MKVCLFEVGSQLREIQVAAFVECSALCAVYIPSGVTVMDGHCFEACTSMSAAIFEPGSKLSDLANQTFQKCRSLTAICIPRAVLTISEYCFDRCRSLAIVAFESGSQLERIRSGAFENCPALRSICLPASLKSLASMRFSGCYLRHLSFGTPAHLTELSLAIPSGFQGGEVHIPDSVLSLSLLLGPGFELPVLVQFDRESCVQTFSYATEY
jgi:hypothetical protein